MSRVSFRCHLCGRAVSGGNRCGDVIEGVAVSFHAPCWERRRRALAIERANRIHMTNKEKVS